ncbi:MAG: bifunctional lysylphosphatidylglycerol flippase/synthetase MprF [Myxococcales bacterium]|nr:bifunctional lysylphosphatidylglycerol flippase/synthetase MprF [Myxococcales bacterium]
MTKHRALQLLVGAVGLGMFVLALTLLHRELHGLRVRDIWRDLRAIPTPRILTAALLTALGYGVLTGYDTLAFRYIGRRLAARRIAFGAFASYAVSNNLGMAGVPGNAVRARLYSMWGVPGVDIARIIGFCAITFWVGFAALAATTFIAHPPSVPVDLGLPFHTMRGVGVVLAAVVAVYLGLSATGRGAVRVRGWEFGVPPLRLAVAQLVVASLDWALAAGVLYALLPSTPTLGYPAFLGVYLMAQVAALASHVPGGLGVLETVVVLLVAPEVPAPAALGSLIAYRAIYYFIPALIAAAALAAVELRRGAESVRTATRRALRVAAGPIVPTILAVTSFVGGVVLLFSGATPSLPHRLRWLGDMIPLPVMELSHFLASVAGAGLILLSRSLERRLDAAYLLTLALLSGGIVFSLLKGLDYEEAAILGAMLVALAPARRYFHREASIFSDPWSGPWLFAVALAVTATVWLGLFSYRHVEYSRDLWWSFALHADAPRMLRATVGVFAAGFLFALAALLRPKAPEPALPSIDDIERAARIVDASPVSSSHLALLGDKSLLFNDDGAAFIMYGVSGRSWIAMGDPVGPRSAWKELVWRFREMGDRHGGWTAFYQTTAESLALYLDVGLDALKLGEEARVGLEDFSLVGSARAELRNTRNKIEKMGGRFEVLDAPAAAARIGELRAVSDAWLADKSAREKGFSLGFFAEPYITRFPCAVVIDRERIVAFANLWPSGTREELSVDLMRHSPDAPHGVMDYLFTKLMLWGRDEGYRWFNLGMAPLAGMEERALAPVWNRVAALVFRHGEHFYNFQGLRRYKDKFDPVWEPRYLAYSGSLAVPLILGDIATLISGGVRGVFTK